MNNKKITRVIFVCMGNICRSPTAHGIFQALIDQHGLSDDVQVESCGTHSYHIGNPPDLRSQATAEAKGIDLSKLSAQAFVDSDFYEFDYIIAMDRANLADIMAMKPHNTDAKISLMLDYSEQYQQKEVPDPYFGEDGFELVFEMLDDASKGLLDEIRKGL